MRGRRLQGRGLRHPEAKVAGLESVRCAGAATARGRGGSLGGEAAAGAVGAARCAGSGRSPLSARRAEGSALGAALCSDAVGPAPVPQGAEIKLRV